MTRRKETRKKSEVLIGSTEHSSVTRTAMNGVALLHFLCRTVLLSKESIRHRSSKTVRMEWELSWPMRGSPSESGRAHTQARCSRIYRLMVSNNTKWSQKERQTGSSTLLMPRLATSIDFKSIPNRVSSVRLILTRAKVTNSVGNGVVHDPAFDWDSDSFEMPNWNETGCL